MTHRHTILVLLFFIGTSLGAQVLKMDCKVETSEGKMDSITLVLENLDLGTLETYSDVHAHRLSLDEDTRYLLTYTREGFISKSILVDTPKKLFSKKKVAFDVVLEAQMGLDMLTYYENPVAYIYFDGSNNLKYETNYRKSIQIDAYVEERSSSVR